MHIVPIASGKGGVGKTFLATNLALTLAKTGRRVILADLDLGASNLHIAMGIPAPRSGIGTFLADASTPLDSIVIDTGYPNLSFIAGDAEIPGLANLKSAQKNMLVRRLSALDCDYLVLDLGAGSHQNILDFFLMSGRGIVITSPALSATMGAYLFLKNAIFRLMYTSFKAKSPAHEYVESLRKSAASLQRVYIPSLLKHVRGIDPESADTFEENLGKFRPRLVMNLLDDPADAAKSTRIRRSAKEYLGVDIEHIGVAFRDSTQDIALASRLPVCQYKPDAILSQSIRKMADRIVQTEDVDDGRFDAEYYDDTFEAANVEAESEFDERIEFIEALMRMGDVSMNDLVETIKSQQYEITQLRRENALIKHKLAKTLDPSAG